MGHRRDLAIEPGADPDQHLRSHDIEQALEEVQPDRDERQGDQRRHAATGQRPIVDLQHVERAGQRQHVDDARNPEQEEKYSAEAAVSS